MGFSVTNETATDGPQVKKPAPLLEFEAKLNATKGKATDSDREAVRAMVDAKANIAVHTITPPQAAILFSDNNQDRNRDLSLAKVRAYAAAMSRGEWKVTHQGIAFYSDGTVADGQHRLGAIVVSDIPQDLLVFPDFKDDAFDAIDIGKARQAKDALQLRGIASAGVKASIAKTAMTYLAEVDGVRSTPTVIEVEAFVEQHNALLDESLTLTQSVNDRVSEPVMSVSEAATVAFMMVLGGYSPQMVQGFIAGIQLGVADYPESPTTELSRVFMKAKHSERRAYSLSKKEKLALAFKGASYFVQNKSVSRLAWKAGKEPLPAPIPPVMSDRTAAE